MKRILLLIPFLLVGCELPDAGPVDDGSADAAANAQAEWDAIAWHGASCAGAAQVMNLQASIAGDKVHFTWDQWPWGGAWGLTHFFVWNGSTWEGGKFDWIPPGGQSVKGFENIYGGYNGLSAPPSGTPVAFAWTSEDGRERSNLSKTVWP